MKKSSSFLDKFVVYFIGGILLLSIIVANLAIFFRYLLEKPFSWSEELLRYLSIWVVFIGAAISYRQDGLVDISFLTDKAKGRFGKFLNVFRHVLTFIFSLIIAYQSIIMMLGEISTSEKSTAMEIPVWIVSVGLVIGSVLLTIFSGLKIFSSMHHKHPNVVTEEIQL